MKKYSKPEITVQQFHSSEYIAATCDIMYTYEWNAGSNVYTFVSVSPQPVFDKNDANGDGFWKAGNSLQYKFSPDGTNYLLIDGELQHGNGTVSIPESVAMSLIPTGTSANHS